MSKPARWLIAVGGLFGGYAFYEILAGLASLPQLSPQHNSLAVGILVLAVLLASIWGFADWVLRSLAIEIRAIGGGHFSEELAAAQHSHDLQIAKVHDAIVQVREDADRELRTSMQWVVKRIGDGPDAVH